jgi:hypothetical protein
MPAFIDPGAGRAEIGVANNRALDKKRVLLGFSQPQND